MVVMPHHPPLIERNPRWVLAEAIPIVPHVELAHVLTVRLSRRLIAEAVTTGVGLGDRVDLCLACEPHDGERFRRELSDHADGHSEGVRRSRTETLVGPNPEPGGDCLGNPL